jgi:hypothetical protein
MVRFLSFCFVMGTLLAQAQPFQTVLVAPNADSYEAALTFSPLGLAVGQTTSFVNAGAGRRVLLTRYTATGGFLSNRVYPNLPGQTVSYEGIDVKPVAASAGLPAGYYVVGNVQKTNPATGQVLSGIFVTRLTTVGVVLWHREYTPPVAQQLRPTAASVEVFTDQSVVVVGNVLSTGTGQQAVLVSRLTAAGGLMWFYRYVHAGCQGQQSSVRAVESARDVTGAPAATAQLCPGGTLTTPQLSQAVVITGDFQPCDPAFTATYGNARRTFVMKINERGVEVWRFAYPSLPTTTSRDGGYDLVQLLNRNFVVVGQQAGPSGGAIRTNIYAFEIQPTGNVVCGAIHQNTQGYNTFARGVTLSPTQGNVVVTGPLDSLSQARRIMVAELQSTCQPFRWANLYPKAIPAMQAEGIDRLTGNLTGYFVTANSNHYSPLDAFGMRTDLTGQVPSCPVVGIKFDRIPATKLEKFPACQQQQGDWVAVQVQSVPVQPVPRICIDLTAPIAPATAEQADAVRITLYPNPSAQTAQIDFLAEHTAGEVVISDLSGNVVGWAAFSSSDSQVRLATGNLQTGLYTIRVLQVDGRTKSARLVKE